MRAARLRVLVAEDNTQIRLALCELIQSEPTFVLVGAATNATDAITIAAAEQPDVVLLDVRMPGGGGPTAALGIRRASPGSRMVALSEHDDRATVGQMLDAGAIGYLVKGCANAEIVAALSSAAEGRGSLSASVTHHVVRAVSEQLRKKARSARRRRTRAMRIQRTLQGSVELTTVFQPIVELAGRTVVGVEALARFAGPPRRTPDKWFAEACLVGLGAELELLAARRAVRSLPHLPEECYLSINVSPATVETAQFHEFVAETGGQRLVAEITEHALVEDYDRVKSAIENLRRLGMRFAVDDAGAGFASLRHILNLGPEIIKLDLTLIRNIHRDHSRRALTAGLIAFARGSGATIVAEGIENAQEAETLVELGVEYGQGYLLGRPSALINALEGSSSQLALR